MPNKAKERHSNRNGQLREMLLRLQGEAYQRVLDLRRDQEQEALSEPADEADCANATEELETHASLISRAEEKLRFVDEAMVRLEAGTYGHCAECAEPIPLERLKAIPFAAYCVSCQEIINRRGRGGGAWGAGSMIPPYDHQWTPPREMAEPTDRNYRSTAPEEQLRVGSSPSTPSKRGRGTSKPAARKQVAKRKK